jgi:ribokinase
VPVRRLKAAVVGHVEWVRFARVKHVPRPGEVVHARDCVDEPAGGGAVAAVQLARLAGDALLITSLGEDELGRRALARLQELGVRVAATFEQAPTREAITLLDARGERTITTLGPRLEPRGEDAALPWEELADMDAVYFTAGDRAALEAARRARVLVASPRAREALADEVELDALVLSADDPIERRASSSAEAQAQMVLLTAGARGGTYRTRAGEEGTWAPAPLRGELVDTYGCGDSFAAAFAYALAAGERRAQALALAARCGAACATGRGPYEGQLRGADLES